MFLFLKTTPASFQATDVEAPQPQLQTPETSTAISKTGKVTNIIVKVITVDTVVPVIIYHYLLHTNHNHGLCYYFNGLTSLPALKECIARAYHNQVGSNFMGFQIKAKG